ncbi:MAG: copper-translocating P-type ATPase, partial [Clostridium sp.]|nr:copper-translocating P-type ATPase [Clostridium sp.]
SIGITLILLYVSMFPMLQDWIGLPIPPFMKAAFLGNENALTYALTQFLLLLPLLAINHRVYRSGTRALFSRRPNMDSLISIGTIAAILYGIFALYRIGYGLGHDTQEAVSHYVHNLYFESAGTILTLIKLGKYLEERAKAQTTSTIEKLMDLVPKKALRINTQGEEEEILASYLAVGDLFMVKPGAQIPTDGVVEEGHSGVNEAAITGESVPADKQPGDAVIGATINQTGSLLCRVTAIGADTTIAAVIRLVEEAGSKKMPMAKLADKVASAFVPVVLVLALLCAVAWLLAGESVEFALSSAITVLVISCPCALGLATPVAIMVGTGVGASHGILFKSGEALQIAANLDTVVLDKTGTITTGHPRLLSVVTLDENLGDNDILILAAALEMKSEHPLAKAVVEAAPNTATLPHVSDFLATPGRGIQGCIESHILYLVNLSHITGCGIPDSEIQRARPLYEKLLEQGQTTLFLADATHILGLLGIADEVKASSVNAITAFRQQGMKVILLSGDQKRVAQAVGKSLGIDEVIAPVLPQEKEQVIQDLRENGAKVVMIGDGINDAPALTAADVGMAIGAGSDIAIESADIILLKNSLKDALTTMKLAKSVLRNIKQNLFWAFIYNLIGIPLAAGLLYPMWQLRLNPTFAAAAMSLSSLFVVGNALRLKRFKQIS